MPTRLFFWPSESICCNAPREATKTNIGKTRLTYNCAHLRLSKKKNKIKLSQHGPRD